MEVLELACIEMRGVERGLDHGVWDELNALAMATAQSGAVPLKVAFRWEYGRPVDTGISAGRFETAVLRQIGEGSFFVEVI